ncbi:MAG: hypothetical protein ABIU54_11360 [Candidatus Eisenbacteria bacterium]
MRRLLLGGLLVALAAFPIVADAGVINPDISLIGQPFIQWTDAGGDPSRKRPVLDAGETEIVFDAALNPYARGWATLSFADGEAGVEEIYFTMLRGLPAGLTLKGGKYRVGFGKLNMVHPHAYPFAERFGVLAAYLPGEEAFNETGLQLSARIPAPGDIALTASVDALQGDSFRLPREPSLALNDPLASDLLNGDRSEESRTALLGRLSAFLPVDDRSGVELGLSGTQGTNNVAAATRTTVLGADVKAKLWTGGDSFLLLQGEALQLDREVAGWDEATARYTRSSQSPLGGYLFADYNWAKRYDAGVSYERFQQPAAGEAWNAAFGAFAGLWLMEETTAFRLEYHRTMPGRPEGAIESPAAANSLRLRVIFSMGPHKAHQF